MGCSIKRNCGGDTTITNDTFTAVKIGMTYYKAKTSDLLDDIMSKISMLIISSNYFVSFCKIKSKIL